MFMYWSRPLTLVDVGIGRFPGGTGYIELISSDIADSDEIFKIAFPAIEIYNIWVVLKGIRKYEGVFRKQRWLLI